MIVFASGKLMGFLIDRYMFDGASSGLTEGSKQSKLSLLKGESFGKALGIANTYMSADDLANEYSNLKPFSPSDLKLNSFFAKNRNYFIQIANENKQMHSHYYHLKKACRKKS